MFTEHSSQTVKPHKSIGEEQDYIHYILYYLYYIILLHFLFLNCLWVNLGWFEHSPRQIKTTLVCLKQELSGRLQVNSGAVHRCVNATDHRKSNIYASFPVLVTGGEVSKLWITKLVAEDKHRVMANIDGFCQSSVSPAVSCMTFSLLEIVFLSLLISIPFHLPISLTNDCFSCTGLLFTLPSPFEV